MSDKIFAIPTAQGQLCLHFGHCEQFALVTVKDDNEIGETEMVTPPPHEPGLLPRWLAEKGATAIIAGGMGQRAQMLFQQAGIAVITGAPAAPPADLVKAYLANSLECGDNACDH